MYEKINERYKIKGREITMIKIFDELETKRTGRGAGIPREEGEALYSFIKQYNITRVIETGIGWGFTSCYILSALPKDGQLISIEATAINKEDTVVPPELWPLWHIIPYSAEISLLLAFQSNKNIDLFVHDSDHSYKNQMFEYETAFPFVDYIGSHDIILQGPPFAWKDFTEKRKINVLVYRGQLGIGTKLWP